jgi:hypothetical protein
VCKVLCRHQSSLSEENAMLNNPSCNNDEKRCEYCGTNKTDVINKAGTLVFNWLSSPYRKGKWICGNCQRRRVFLKARLHGLVRVRMQSDNKVMICEYCGSDKRCRICGVETGDHNVRNWTVPQYHTCKDCEKLEGRIHSLRVRKGEDQY